jgi:hypothetical protein
MRVRIVKPLLTMLLCASAACAYAQMPLSLPDAPHVVAADLGAMIPEPPSVTRETTSLPLPPLSPAAMVTPAAPLSQPKPKLLDKKFIGLGAAVFGLTAMDLEMTQHCLHRGTCRELDPTLPNSHWGMYAVNTPVNLAVMYLSYRRRAAHKWDWWLAPAIDIGSHVGGVGSNIRFIGK